MLVLKRMGQLMGHYRLLVFGSDPVQQIDRLGLVVVETGDLLLQQAHQEWLESKIPVEQSKFFEHDLFALHVLGIFIVAKLRRQRTFQLVRG